MENPGDKTFFKGIITGVQYRILHDRIVSHLFFGHRLVYAVWYQYRTERKCDHFCRSGGAIVHNPHWRLGLYFYCGICFCHHVAVARVGLDVVGLLFPKPRPLQNRKNFAITVVLLAVVNFFVIAAFSANMGQLVALATFVSFVVAPIIGYMNLKNVTSDDMPDAHHPKIGLRILTYAGIAFLSFFSIYYFWIVVF